MPETQTTPTIVAEGRLARIDLRVSEATEVRRLITDDPESPVELRSQGPRGFYIRVFDHRKGAREAFQLGGMPVYAAFFILDLPCVCGFRLKGATQYVALNDVGTPDMRDGGEGEGLLLTRAGSFDKSQWKVMAQGKALHLDTGICLCEPRLPKP